MIKKTVEREEYIGIRRSQRAVEGASTAEDRPVEWPREGEPNEYASVGETEETRRYHVSALVGVR